MALISNDILQKKDSLWTTDKFLQAYRENYFGVGLMAEIYFKHCFNIKLKGLSQKPFKTKFFISS